MLEKSILDKPEIIRAEQNIQPIKLGKGWIIKMMIILIILGLLVWLFLHPEKIQNSVNGFFDNLLN